MFKIKLQSERVPNDERESKLYYYQMRGSDYDCGRPISLEKFVGVNYCGTLISTVSLDKLFKGKSYIPFRGRGGVIAEHEDSGEFFDGSLLFPNLTYKNQSEM